MALKMVPEIVSREYVRPSTSTAQNPPTIHTLSIFDQSTPYMYIPLLFFYSSRDSENDHNHRSCLLKSSLSAALSHYYPLAGRIKDDVTVDCNDEGALFLEARTECDLSELLMNPDFEALGRLCPDNLSYKDSSLAGPVVVQVTYFKCGGMSIGLCLCHRVMDMATMSSFINDWASLAREPDKEILSPEFNIGFLYPLLDRPFEKPTDPARVETKDLVWRRLVFRGSKITKLKERVGDQVPNPTRVEVVTALLHKSAIKAVAMASSSGTVKASVMNHAMNLRAHVNPPLSNRNKGNVVGLFQVSAPGNKEVTLEWLVNEFRKSKSRFFNSCANASNGKEICALTSENLKQNAEHEVYTCSSWCRNRFYESDFGWGKPVWVGPTYFEVKNHMFLLDTREGDGVEVHICLEDVVMAVFERDEELISFCSINPSIMDSPPRI